MKELKDLNDIEETILMACCDACDFGLSAHVPKGEIQKRAKLKNPKYFKKGFRTLLTNGFIREHPTRKNRTYQLNQKGLDGGRILHQKILDSLNN